MGDMATKADYDSFLSERKNACLFIVGLLLVVGCHVFIYVCKTSFVPSSLSRSVSTPICGATLR